MKISNWLAFLICISINIESMPSEEKFLEWEVLERGMELGTLSPEESRQIKKEQEFYELFNDTGTVLETEYTVTYDDFGDAQENVDYYFTVNNQRYDVNIYCKLNDLNRYPFDIYARFPKKLDYETTKSAFYFAHIRLQYKLQSGFKDVYYRNGVMTIMKNNFTAVDSGKLDKIYISGTETPLLSNFKERKESLSNGEISIVIPARSSDEKYLLKVNPFHNSWAEAHNEKCEAIPLPTLFPDKYDDIFDLMGDDF